MSQPVYSISLSARVTLDMHSLNNEGGEGNQIQTRMVNIVDSDRRLQNVNAISGDMTKHILAEHLYRIALRDNLDICEGCRVFNANRISADQDFLDTIADVDDGTALTAILKHCATDDLLGNLITAGNKSLPRKSVVEFGWVVGLPEVTATDSYFHVKYASERSAGQRDAARAEEARGANLGQAIFHRPANSGIYALVATVEAARIGLNDITQQYVLAEEERARRYRALLEALLYTLVEPAGAMRNTQAPHILDVSGVLTVSQDIVPAPTLSPLKKEYEAQLTSLCDTLNSIRPDALQARTFGSLDELASVMAGLLQNGSPLALSYETA